MSFINYLFYFLLLSILLLSPVSSELFSNGCDSTVKNCKTCDSSDKATCQNCTSGYFLNDSTSECDICYLDTNCTDCDTDGITCTACKTGTYLDKSNKCQPCSDNCYYCSNQYICTICDAGYYPKATIFPPGLTCSPCISPCKTCLTQTQCISCVSGSFLNVSLTTITSSSATCLNCSSNCGECLLTATNCTSCPKDSGHH